MAIHSQPESGDGHSRTEPESNMKAEISCIVRHHNPKRLLELQRCLFSLAGQTIRHIEIILMLQRFSPSQIGEIKQIAEPLLALRDDLRINIINFQASSAADARTYLLDIGCQRATGHHLGFLDYDDVLYPEAYEILTNQMRTDKAGVAFASVRIVKANPHKSYSYIYSHTPQKKIFPGEGLNDLMTGNFCPLHSYIFDRSLLLEHNIRFDPTLTWEEDYDFLLQSTAKIPSTFTLLRRTIGDYYIKSDQSNSLGMSVVENTMSDEQARTYAAVKARIEVRRRITTLSEAVQKCLGIRNPIQGLTIRKYLDQTSQA